MSEEDGYVTVTLGMFDKHISQEVFEDFKKRCHKGVVYSEFGSPRQTSLMTDDEFLQRFSTLDLARAAAQILDVEMSPDGTRMIGKVKAAGGYADLFKNIIEDDTHFAFGMRSFHYTEDRDQKRPMHVITYDVINPE